LLELRHAAAGWVENFGRDAVMREHPPRRLADRRVVVIDEAGRIEHRLAPEAGCRLVDGERLLARTHGQGAAMIFGECRLAMDVGELLHDGPRQMIALARRP